MHGRDLIALALLGAALNFAAREAGAGSRRPAETRLLTDFTTDLPEGDENVTVSMRFVGIRPLPGGAKGDVVVQLQRRGGKWADTGHSAAADYNQKSTNVVRVADLKLAGDRITGGIHVTIGPDSPRPGKTGFPSPADEFQISIDARVDRGKPAPFQPDREAFMPPWRKDVPSFGGERIRGTYKAAGPGEIIGALSPAMVAGRFGAEGNVHITKASGGGMRLLARLSPKRVAPPPAAWAVKRFDKPADWRRFDALRLTVASKSRRSDAAVAVRIAEADGSSFSVTSAALLLGREATFDVPFADFRGTGGNYFLDLDRVTAIGVGADNPHGVGDVEFVVRMIELVRSGRGLDGPPRKAATVKLDPARRISFHGAEEVPKGLFGFHDVGHDRPRQPKTIAASPTEYMRQLNPGYLRPLRHVGFGAKPITDEQIKEMIADRLASKAKPTDAFFRRAEAAGAIDNVVWCHTQDLWARPSWMDRDRRKVLDGVKAFYRALAAKAWVPGEEHNVLRRLEVWNEPFMWGRHINMGFRNPPGRKAWSDPTQYGYIPARLGAEAYSDIFLAAVEGASSANRHVKLGGPCAPAFSGDSYANFTHYVRHFLDRCHDKVDFLTEHHYFGLPASYAASYEVVKAFCDVKYNRRIPIYNTECNDLGRSAANKAYYNIRDILECIRVCPDVARGRAVHALWNGYCRSPGETDAFTILSTLRGKMIDARSSDPAIVAVAAERPDGKIVVFALNDSNFARRVELAAPAGYRLDELIQLNMEDDTSLKGIAASGEAALDAREAARWTLSPEGDLRRRIAVRRIEQSFCDVLLARVEPPRSISGKVIWRRAGPPAKKAALRVITRDVHRGEAVAVINGKQIPLPFSSSNDGCSVAQDVAVDPAVLKSSTTIEFRCVDPKTANGFTVCAASILLEN